MGSERWLKGLLKTIFELCKSDFFISCYQSIHVGPMMSCESLCEFFESADLVILPLGHCLRDTMPSDSKHVAYQIQ